MANVFTGRNQALNEQQQAYNIGQGMFQQSFLPGQFMNQDLQAATPFADIQRMLQQQGIVTAQNLGTAGLEAGVNTERDANALRQMQLQGIMNSVFGTGSGGGLLSSIFNQSGDTQSDNDYFANIARILGEL